VREFSFSIIIPVKSINDFVRENVQAFLALGYQKWEIYIVTNVPESSEWVDERIFVIDSGKVSPAIKRNLGVEKSRGDIILFLDDDSFPRADLLDVYNRVFQDSKQSAVGGPGITPSSDGFLAQLSGAFYESKFLGGNPHRYRSIKTEAKFDDWPSVNFAIRGNVFRQIGGFQTDHWPGEDTILCRNLLQNGFLVSYQYDAVVFHHRRNSLVSHLKQIAGYGLHRGNFARRFPENSRKFNYFLPSGLALYMGGLLIYRLLNLSLFLNHLPWFPLYVYLLYILFGAFENVRNTGIEKAIFLIPLAFFSHLIYGLFFIKGFFLIKALKSELR
jgi:GT2 family glycosyltransferase